MTSSALLSAPSDPWCTDNVSPPPAADISPPTAPLPVPRTVPRTADELDELGARIVGLSARIAAATCRWLLLVADFDRREGCARWGLASTAQWLSHSCGIAHRTAVEHVRVARALSAFPALAAALQKGRISYSHARAISRLALPGEEQLVTDLLEVAEHGSVGQLEDVVRGLRTVDDNNAADNAAADNAADNAAADNAAADNAAGDNSDDNAAGADSGEYLRHGWAARTSHWQLSTRLAPERGALVQSALTQLAAAEQISTAEALVRMAEIALAALQRRPEGPPRGLRGHEHAAVVIHLNAAALTAGPSPQNRGQDGAGAGAEAEAAGAGGAALSTTSATTATTTATTTAGARSRERATDSGVERPGVERPGVERPFGRIADGPGLPRRVIERLLCACRIRVAVLDTDRTLHRNAEDRTVLDLGRTKRLVNDRQLRALILRDRHCTHPGCTSTSKLQAHHVIHWLHGGRTDLTNLVLLCERHHHAHHDGAFSITRTGSRRHGTFEFHRPDGSILPHHINPTHHVERDAPPVEGDYPHIPDTAMLSKTIGDRLDRAWAIAVLAERRQGGRAPAAA